MSGSHGQGAYFALVGISRPNQKIAAIQLLIERAEGKPTQAIQVSPGLSDQQALRLLELNERLEQGSKEVGLPIGKPN